MGVAQAFQAFLADTPALARALNRWRFARRLISDIVIDQTASSCPARPHAHSLWTPPGKGSHTPPAWAARQADAATGAEAVRAADYVSWASLTDRDFTGRHLPPAPARALPDIDALVDLFMRPPGHPMRESSKNTVLLGFFAQWFTDSFLRTDRADLRRNTSNHEIDFCQVYGLDEERCTRLREMAGGRLLSRMTETGEYPPLLMRNGQVDPAFASFDYVQPIPGGTGTVIDWFLQQANLTDEERAARRPFVYATGLERGSSNIAYAAISTLFLREHNRLARAIEAANPGWSDDRIFHAARNTVIVIGLKIVVEDYIVQLAQSPIRLLMNPGLAPGKAWNRSNRIALEFNLLYRWHSMAPDSVEVAGRALSFHDMQFNNGLLESIGLEGLVAALSAAPAGYIGMRNVPQFLRGAETSAQDLSRRFALQGMNAYRARFGLDRIASFEALTADPELRQKLSDLYGGDIDAVELLPGLFAEDDRADASFGSLLMRMVGYDAFTQALTNPLLAPQVFVPATFSEVGWQAIEGTRSLDDMFQRNIPANSKVQARLGLPGSVT